MDRTALGAISVAAVVKTKALMRLRKTRAGLSRVHQISQMLTAQGRRNHSKNKRTLSVVAVVEGLKILRSVKGIQPSVSKVLPARLRCDRVEKKAQLSVHHRLLARAAAQTNLRHAQLSQGRESLAAGIVQTINVLVCVWERAVYDALTHPVYAVRIRAIE